MIIRLSQGNHIMKKNLLYWKGLNIKNKVQIFFKNKAIRFSDWRNNRKQNQNMTRGVFLNSIKTFILGVILVIVFRKIDSFLHGHIIFQDLNLDKSLFQYFLMGGIGVAGIFFGLYYSSIAAIYSSVYINAPTSIRMLFQNDNLIKKNISSISNYMVLALIFIGDSFINTNPGIFTLSFWIIYSVIIVLTYSLSGNRSYELTDSYILVNNIYSTLNKTFVRVSSKRKVYLDDNVHYYLQKNATRQLSYINDIARFNIDTLNFKGPLVNNFISANFVLIKSYWMNKFKIPYSSKWFKDRAIYEKWYEVDDSAVSIALSTGTPLPTKNEQDRDWFEDKVMDINNKFYSIFIEEKELDAILSYFYNLTALGEYSAELNELNFFLKHIEDTQNKLKTFIIDNPDFQKNGVTTANLLDALLNSYIATAIGVNRYLSNLDLEMMLTYASSLKRFKDADYSRNKFVNNATFKKIYDGIEAECKIEKNKITPDWYVEEKLANFVLDEYQEILYCISKIYREFVYDLGVTLFDNKQYFIASLVFTRMTGLKAKCDLTFGILRVKVTELESILGSDKIKEFNEKLNSTELSFREIDRHVPRYLVKSTGLFSLDREEELNQYPDMLGYSYNVVCEFLVDAIENNDVKSFQNGYKYFLNIVLLYEDYIRKDLTTDFESRNIYAATNAILSPRLEYSQISGYAYLWGEVSCNVEWKEIIEENLDLFLKDKTNRTEEIIERWIDSLKYFQNRLPAIYNRDIIRTEWSTRVGQLILKSDLLNYRMEKYGNTSLNTKNPFLKSFLGNSTDMVLFNDPQDIFAITFLNSKVSDSKKYVSRNNWEKKWVK